MSKLTGDQITDLQNFFNLLYRDISEGFIEVRFFGDKNRDRKFLPLSNIPQLISCIEEHNSLENCYFGVAVRRNQKNGQKENCQFLTALYADIDYGSAGHKKNSFFETQTEVLNHIQKFSLKPSIIVDSGHGTHLFWLLNQPMELNSKTVKFIEAAMARIHKVVGGDSVQNIDRILRIPETLNLKEEPFKKCSIISIDRDLRYSIDEIKSILDSNPIYALAWNKIKSEYYNMLFGHFDTEPNDRSATDQQIITYLKSIGASEDQIELIFEYFPTTGKYWERKEKDPSGAQSYLVHSIKKAESYMSNQTTASSTQKLVKVLRLRNYVESVGYRKPNNDSYENDFDNDETEVKYTPKNENSYFTIEEDREFIGYYQNHSHDGKPKRKRLSNFIVNFNKQVSAIVDKQPLSKLDGVLHLVDGTEKKFNAMPACFLANPQKLKEFLLNLGGTRISFYGNSTLLVEAIKFFNKDVEVHEAQEFGYNKELTQYATTDFIIHANKIEEKQSPILYSESWDKIQLGFDLNPQKALDDVRHDILHEFLTWDSPSVMYYSFAFTMLPLIYPFLRAEFPGKPYLMLQGVTGCGKTTLSKLQFSFFGKATALTSITSTHTIINVKGHAFKDALFIVDDVKSANLDERELKKITAATQNYYDEHSRERSNVNLESRDPKWIRGFLQYTAEDVIFQEASTIARGIIIPMEKKEIDGQKIKSLYNVSSSFSFFTLKFIQHLLSIQDKKFFSKTLEQSIEFFEQLAYRVPAGADNLPRMINNFALLKTSWDIASDFLFSAKERENKSFYNAKFDDASVELFDSNVKRLRIFKPEDRFEEALWTMAESNTAHFSDVNSTFTDHPDKELGLYKKQENGSIRLGIKFKHAYKLVNEYLRSEGGIGIKEATLKTALERAGKISTVETGRVTIGSQTFRGVYWTGEIPYETLGLSKPQEPIASTPTEKTADFNDHF